MKRIFLTKENFIEKSNKLHGNKYNYELINDFNSNANIIITCPTHGTFLQKPHNHLKGYGCPECFKDSQKKTHDEFASELSLIYPNLTIIDNYVNNYTKILVIDEFGFIYSCTPASLLKNHPSIRSCTDKNKLFKFKSDIVHNNMYDYSLCNYINCNTKVKIICSIHGLFEQNPSNHLFGQGCPKCNKITVYEEQSWTDHCKNKNSEPFVYIIRCYNHIEEFVKIGITSRTLNQRFHNKKDMPYNFNIIKIINGAPEFVFNKEIELHNQYMINKYIPKIKFNGMYECFSIDILNSIIS